MTNPPFPLICLAFFSNLYLDVLVCRRASLRGAKRKGEESTMAGNSMGATMSPVGVSPPKSRACLGEVEDE